MKGTDQFYSVNNRNCIPPPWVANQSKHISFSLDNLLIIFTHLFCFLYKSSELCNGKCSNRNTIALTNMIRWSAEIDIGFTVIVAIIR